MDRAVVLVGEAGIEEGAPDRRLDLGLGGAPGRARHNADAPGEFVRPGAQVLGDVVENLRPVVRRRCPPATRPWLRPRPRCGCPCGCRAPRGRSRRPLDRGRRNCSRNRAAPACRRHRVWRCGRAVHAAARRRPRQRAERHGLRRIGLARWRVGDAVLEEALAAALAAEAALAIAAEARSGVEQVGRIDPDDARLDAGRDFERAVDVLRPHRRRKAVARVVGERDRLVGRAEGHGDQHRAENLLARQDRSRLDPGDQGRGIEAAAIRAGDRPPARTRAPPRPPSRISRSMRSSWTGATIAPTSVDLSSGSPTRSLAMRARSFAVKCVRDAFGRQQPRARAADLPLVEPDRVDDALDRAVEIGVLEDDERRLAAELERQLLAGSRGRLADGAADLGRAGEGDLVDAVVRDERRARSRRRR